MRGITVFETFFFTLLVVYHVSSTPTQRQNSPPLLWGDARPCPNGLCGPSSGNNGFAPRLRYPKRYNIGGGLTSNSRLACLWGNCGLNAPRIGYPGGNIGRGLTSYSRIVCQGGNCGLSSPRVGFLSGVSGLGCPGGNCRRTTPLTVGYPESNVRLVSTPGLGCAGANCGQNVAQTVGFQEGIKGLNTPPTVGYSGGISELGCPGGNCRHNTLTNLAYPAVIEGRNTQSYVINPWDNIGLTPTCRGGNCRLNTQNNGYQKNINKLSYAPRLRCLGDNCGQNAVLRIGYPAGMTPRKGEFICGDKLCHTPALAKGTGHPSCPDCQHTIKL